MANDKKELITVADKQRTVYFKNPKHWKALEAWAGAEDRNVNYMLEKLVEQHVPAKYKNA